MSAADYGIDLGKKLSTEDRQFLLDRNYWREVQSNDEDHGLEVEEPESPFIDPTTDTTPKEEPADLGSGQRVAPEQVDGDDVTKEDLKAILDARGIDYPSNALKDDLLALVNGDPAEDEDEDEDPEEGAGE